MKTDVTVVSFDYSRLPADLADEARAIAVRVREKTKSMTVTVLELGRDLTYVKARLGHGAFGAWLEAEFRGGTRTAQNYMRAFEAFGDKCEIVSHLPPTAVYALAAPSVPERTRARVVKRLSAGEAVDAAEVRALVRDAKEKLRRRREEALGGEPLALPAPPAMPAAPAGQAPAAPAAAKPDAGQRRKLETAQRLAELFRARLTQAELETLLDLGRSVPDVWAEVGKTLLGRREETKSAGPLFDMSSPEPSPRSREEVW
jgi:hypothetical protein